MMLWIKKKKDNKVVTKRTAGIKKRSSDNPRKFSRFLFYFLTVSFFSVSIYVFFFSDFCRIKRIEITGNVDLSSSQIDDFIKSKIEGRYWKVFPRDNFFFISSSSIEKALLDNFKKIRIANISKFYPDSIKIKIAERKSLLIWCSRDICHVLDEEGTAYDRIELDSPLIQQNDLIKLVDLSERSVEEGENILDRDSILFLTGLKEEIEKSQIIAPDTDWKTPSPVSQKFEVESKEEWKIFFSAKVDHHKALRTLKIFLESEIGEEKRKDLEYVDLRVENKIFYKLKEEEKEEGESNDKKV
jgi:cell division septal protein FtsQ